MATFSATIATVFTTLSTLVTSPTASTKYGASRRRGSASPAASLSGEFTHLARKQQHAFFGVKPSSVLRFAFFFAFSFSPTVPLSSDTNLRLWNRARRAMAASQTSSRRHRISHVSLSRFATIRGSIRPRPPHALLFSRSESVVSCFFFCSGCSVVETRFFFVLFLYARTPLVRRIGSFDARYRATGYRPRLHTSRAVRASLHLWSDIRTGARYTNGGRFLFPFRRCCDKLDALLSQLALNLFFLLSFIQRHSDASLLSRVSRGGKLWVWNLFLPTFSFFSFFFVAASGCLGKTNKH